MRKVLGIWLALCLLLAGGAALGETTLYQMTDEDFTALEAAFRAETFAGEAGQVELGPTQKMIFATGETARYMPSMLFTVAEETALSLDIEWMVALVGSIIESALTVQEALPEAFIFDTARAAAYDEAGG